MVKLKYYESGATFDASSLNNDDIAFVEDSKTIYTHGVEFKPEVDGETIHVSKNNAYIAPGTWPDRAQYTGTVDEDITLHEGLTVLYKLPTDFEEGDGGIANTLNINNLGEYRIRVNSKVTYEAGDLLLLVYREHVSTNYGVDGHV